MRFFALVAVMITYVGRMGSSFMLGGGMDNDSRQAAGVGINSRIIGLCCVGYFLFVRTKTFLWVRRPRRRFFALFVLFRVVLCCVVSCDV